MPRPSEGSGLTFGVVLGLLLGALGALLVAPGGKDETKVVEAAAPGPAAASDQVAAATGPGSGDGATAVAGVAGAARPGSGPSAGGARAAGGGVTAAGTAGAAAAGGATARGVTASKIRIGFAELDIAALSPLGPRYNQGDPEQQARSVYEAWKREGKVPVHGREIEFVYRKYGVLNPEEARSACINMVQQDKVFAVVARAAFGVGSECVAREQQTPLIVTDEQRDDLYQRAPLLFSTFPSLGQALRNLPHWAHSEGLLRGKKIGIYYDDSVKVDVDRDFTPQLRQLGYSYTVEAVTSDSTNGGPEDAIAVQRAKSSGVDVMFMWGVGTFMDQAQANDYHPKYLMFPVLFGTGDTTNSSRNQVQMNGTRSMAYLRHGERGAGLTFDQPTEKCTADFERYSGKQVPRKGVYPNAEEISLLNICDVMNVMLEGLIKAGPGLTHASFVSGLEGIRGLGMASSAPITFGPGLHHGVASWRNWIWDSPCQCGKVDGSPAWRPFFVP